MMPMMYAFFVIATLQWLLPTVLTQKSPVIETQGEDIVISSANLYRQKYNGLGQLSDKKALVDYDELNKYTQDFVTQDQLETLESLRNLQRSDLMLNLGEEIRSNISEIVKSQEQKFNSLNNSLNELIEMVKFQNLLRIQEIQNLSDALDLRLPASNVTCGDYTLLNGNAVGHNKHNSPGAVRTLKCMPGYELTSPNPVVICGSDGKWSDDKKSRCKTPDTTAPTAAPSDYPYEMVTCCMSFDNILRAAYVDGQHLRLYGTASWGDVARFTFPSTHKVLGLFGNDGECGCNCGYMALICSTPSGKGRWNFWMPGSSGDHDHQLGDRRMSIYTFYQGAAYRNPFPDWAKQTNSGNFSQVDFDAEGKGFVEPEWNRWNRDSHLKIALKEGKHEECPVAPDDNTFGTFCGGKEPTGRVIANWWARFNSVGQK